MKKITLSFLALSILLISGFASYAQQSDKTPYLFKTFPAGKNGNLIAEASGGRIKVTGSGGNEIKVKVFVSPVLSLGRNKAPSEEALAAYTFEIRQDGNTVYAMARNNEHNWRLKTALNVYFEIEVPYQVACNLNSSGGRITIENLTGNQSASTGGGPLNVQNLHGNFIGRTSGGSLEINNFNGLLDIRTGGGSVRISKAAGTIAAGTSGGSLRLNNVSGNIQAETGGGSIRANILELEKYITFRSSGGSIHATLPHGSGLDLDLKGDKVKTVIHNFTGTVKENLIKGSVNGGGIPVKMSTSGGTLKLMYGS